MLTFLNIGQDHLCTQLHKIFCNRGIVWMLQTSSKSGFPTFPFLERMATAMAVPFMKHNPASPARAVMAVAQRCAAHAGAAKWPKDPRAWHTADLGGSLHSGCGHTVGRGGMYESWIWEENLKVQLSWWWPLSSLCTTRSEVFAENAMHLLTKTGGLQLQPRTLSRQPSQEAPPTTPRVPTAAALRRVPTPQCGCHRYWPSIQVNCMWDSWCAQEKIGQHEVSSTLSIPTKPPMKVLEDVPNVVAATSYRYLDCRVPRRSHKGFVRKAWESTLQHLTLLWEQGEDGSATVNRWVYPLSCWKPWGERDFCLFFLTTGANYPQAEAEVGEFQCGWPVLEFLVIKPPYLKRLSHWSTRAVPPHSPHLPTGEQRPQLKPIVLWAPKDAKAMMPHAQPDLATVPSPGKECSTWAQAEVTNVPC